MFTVIWTLLTAAALLFLFGVGVVVVVAGLRLLERRSAGRAGGGTA